MSEHNFQYFRTNIQENVSTFTWKDYQKIIKNTLFQYIV